MLGVILGYVGGLWLYLEEKCFHQFHTFSSKFLDLSDWEKCPTFSFTILINKNVKRFKVI